MKILLITSARLTGISYWRQLMPHAYLKTVNKEVEIDQIQSGDHNEIFSVGDEKLKEYQIAVLCREISADGSGVKTIQRLQGLGVKVVLDVDDYWVLPKWHPLYRAYANFNIPEQIVNNIRVANYVTTPNKRLASFIKMINDKVLYLPNVPDTNQPQFKRNEIISNRLRFGWVGGVFHRLDIEPMERSFTKLWKDETIKDKWQVCLGGFNPNGEYKAIEKIFSNNFKQLKYDYKEYLNKDTPMLAHIMNNEPYKRLWAKQADQYVSMYNEIDVALVPLRQNDFNECKSALKIVEAAAMGCGVIASNVYPYNELLNEGNSIKIGTYNPHKEWYEAMKWAANNPDKVSILANQLSIDMAASFNIDKVTKERKDLYTWLTK